VTASSDLERRYRRLLAWYPQPFRSQQEDEILAVLMAGAGQGQSRPRLAEAVDLIKSAVGMRLWPPRSGPNRRDLADGLAAFSVLAPLFLLAVGVLQVALPYHLPQIPFLVERFGAPSEIGGASLLRVPLFGIAAGCEMIIAVFVLLGMRWLALVTLCASVAYWAASRGWVPWVPYPLQLITAGVYLLEMAALLFSPGPRRGRELVGWRHGTVLLLAAGAFQGFALWYAATASPFVFPVSRPVSLWYLAAGTFLAVAGLALAVVFRLGRYFLLLLAAASYPCAAQLVSSHFGGELLGMPTPGHLTVLFLPPVLFALGIVFATTARPRIRIPARPA
jgi:hypothetical protein